MDSLNLKIKKQADYNKPSCCNSVWLITLSAKPQDLEVLLQEEKQIIPRTQIAINITFFIVIYFTS